jgi:hypothetical protein
MMVLPRVSPGSGVLAAAGQVWATMWAEITMQWRRWGFWAVFASVGALVLLITVPSAIFLSHLPPTSPYVQQHYTREDLNNLMTLGTTTYASLFFGLASALLVVDRVPRDQRLGMVEVQRATPQGAASYVLGKFLGNALAVLLPPLLGYLLCALVTLPLGWPASLLPKFLLAFLLVFVPASLAVVGLNFFLVSILPLRVVQVGFSLLWLYFNTGLSQYGFGASIVNPGGLYVYPIFLPVPHLQYTTPNFHTSLPLALLNIAALLLTALVALLLTGGSLAFQRHHQEGA